MRINHKFLVILFSGLVFLINPVPSVFADCNADGCGTVGYDSSGTYFYCAVGADRCRFEPIQYCTAQQIGQPCCVGPNRASLCNSIPTNTPVPAPPASNCVDKPLIGNCPPAKPNECEIGSIFVRNKCCNGPSEAWADKLRCTNDIYADMPCVPQLRTSEVKYCEYPKYQHQCVEAGIATMWCCKTQVDANHLFGTEPSKCEAVPAPTSTPTPTPTPPTSCNPTGITGTTIKYCDLNSNGSRNLGESPYTYCTVNSSGSACCVGPEANAGCAAIVASFTPAPPPPPPPTTPPSPTPRVFTPYESPSNSFFDMLNPLRHAGGENIFEDAPSAYADELSTPGGIVSRVLTFAFPLAGLILFVMLVWGGFEILIQAPSKKGIDAGKQRVTAAIIGFILLFSSYWIWQIIEVIFGVIIF